MSYQRQRPYPIFDHAAVGLPVPDTRTSSSSTNTTHVLVHGGLLAIDQLAPPPAVTAVVLDPTGGRAPRLIGGALHHRFGHQLNRIPQRTSIFHWILITGGVVVTNAQDDENSPTGTAVVGCCCCLDLGTTPTRPRMRHVPTFRCGWRNILPLCCWTVSWYIIVHCPCR